MSTRCEEWRDIPGYGGAYQVSDWGRIRTFRTKGHRTARRSEPKIMKIYEHNSGTTVCLRGKNGVPTAKENASITTLVALAFLGGVPSGMKAIHRNGNIIDNRLCNIALVTNRQHMEMIQRMAGPKKLHKPVLKFDTALEIVAVYRSSAEAGKANYYHQSTIADYCNLVPKSVIASDGYIYAWDDDKWLRKMLQRAKVELDALGIRYNDPYTECYYNLPPEPECQIDLSDLWLDEAPSIVGMCNPAFG